MAGACPELVEWIQEKVTRKTNTTEGSPVCGGQAPLRSR
jgi:hypothetical protein